jgi:uncharacterized spore protein YtfJ
LSYVSQIIVRRFCTSETYLKSLTEELSKLISTETVIGEPIVQEDKVLIPVTKLGFAFGAGTGKSSGQGPGGEGTGGGGGGGIMPVALIAIFKNTPGPEGVKIYPLKPQSRMPEVIEKVIESMATMYEKKHPKQTKEEEPTKQE